MSRVGSMVAPQIITLVSSCLICFSRLPSISPLSYSYLDFDANKPVLVVCDQLERYQKQAWVLKYSVILSFIEDPPNKTTKTITIQPIMDLNTNT